MVFKQSRFPFDATTWNLKPEKTGGKPAHFPFLFTIPIRQEQVSQYWSLLCRGDCLWGSCILALCRSSLDQARISHDALHAVTYLKAQSCSKELSDLQQFPSTVTGRWGVTHADLPSTSSLVGLTPFLARMDETFSTSPLSAAFINLSSYLFQSVFSCGRESEQHVSLRYATNLPQEHPRKAQLYTKTSGLVPPVVPVKVFWDL